MSRNLQDLFRDPKVKNNLHNNTTCCLFYWVPFVLVVESNSSAADIALAGNKRVAQNCPSGQWIAVLFAATHSRFFRKLT